MKATQRKTILRLCIILGVILTLIVGWLVFDHYVDRSGWVEKDGQYSYRDFHGQKITGWLELDDRTCYFDENHIMVTGWQELDGHRYYFGTNGIMYTGWKNVDNIRCYFESNGMLHTGWLDLDGKRYYLESSGAMVSGWKEIAGDTYYFGENGAMVSGWNNMTGITYYFDESGRLITGHVTLEGSNYYFLEDGMMFTGWEHADDGIRFYGTDGIQVFGWTQIEEKLYCFGEDGLMKTGWYEEEEYRYYFHEDGAAAIGPTEIDGQLYHFTPMGIMVVLVNADLSVPSYYKPDLTTYIPWHEVDSLVLEPLTKMLEDCTAAGYPYEFNSAYRSIKVQQEILSLRTQEYEAKGYPNDQAYLEARKTVALPGTSEHHLGLAVDILNVKDNVPQALEWLGEHCWEYGFILRYAADKAEITGIIHEPWHFRYVGTRVSMDMKDSGLCLEEYLGAAPVENPAIS